MRLGDLLLRDGQMQSLSLLLTTDYWARIYGPYLRSSWDRKMMVECFSMKTATRVGDAFVQMLEVRHKLFIEQENYGIPSRGGLELDRYDTRETVYFVDRDARQRVVGVLRISPTVVPYMIQEHWPHSIFGGPPSSKEVWEATRIGVTTPKEQRRKIVQRLLVAQLEFALSHEIASFIGIMPPKLWNRVFFENGWRFRELGPVFRIDGYRYPVVTAELPVSEAAEQAVRSASGLEDPLLRIA